MEQEEPQPIVVDNGSFTVKSGWAGEDGPRATTPPVVGTRKYKAVMVEKESGTWRQIPPRVAYGNVAMNHRPGSEIEYAIKHGVIEVMEEVWKRTFDELIIKPEEHPVLMTHHPLGPKKQKEKIIEVLMEKFNIPATYLAIPSLLTVYASGRACGLAVDSGEGVTTTVPVFEGYSMLHTWNRVNFGGEDLNEYLLTLLRERGYSFNTSSEMEIVRDIKEKLCYTSLDYEDALETTRISYELDKSYELPDGQIITLGSERFRTCEAMFKPSMVGLEQLGIHEMIHECIQKGDMHTRKMLYGNIILSGGNTLFPELGSRLEKEISALAHSATRVRVITPPERLHSVWIGGSILASLSTFQRNWIKTAEYKECGPSIVHKYCEF